MINVLERVEKNGAGHEVRTRDIQLGKQDATAQKPLKTLGKIEVNTIGVTQSVTHNTENITQAALLKALQNFPKDQLVQLLIEAIQNT